MQLVFALTQVLLALGIYGLVRSDVIRPARGSRTLSVRAVLGMALTVPGELVLIAARSNSQDLWIGVSCDLLIAS
jgi:hypothetical protein